MTLVDDRTGAPTTLEQFLSDVRTERERVTARLVEWVARAMATGTPEQNMGEEHGFTELFEYLLPGAGGAWISDVYRQARYIREQSS